MKKSTGLGRCWISLITVAAILFHANAASGMQGQDIERAKRLHAFISENLNTNWTEIPDSVRLLIKISEKLDDRQYHADAHKFMGVFYFRVSESDSSIYHYTRSATLNKEIGNALEAAKNTLNIGMSYRNKGEFDKTIEYSLEAARYFNEVNEHKGMAIVYNMIGSVYYYQNRYEESVQYMQLYMEYAEKTGDLQEMAGANQNLGSVLNAMGSHDEALIYLKKALELHTENNDKLGIANSAINISTIYIENGDLSKGEPWLKQALEIGHELGSPRLVMESTANLAVIYVNAGRYSESFAYSNILLETAVAHNDKYMHAKALENRASANYRLGNFEEAYELRLAYEEVNQHIINEKNLEKIAELREQYESEKKEQQIELQKLQLSEQELVIQRNRVLQSGLGVTLLLLIAAGFLWQSRVRQRELEYRVGRLETEQKIQNERERISRDLHDHVGAQLVNIISGIELAGKYSQVNEEESVKIISSVKEEAQETIRKLRETIWALKSNEITLDAFVDYLHRYIKQVESVTGLKISTRIEDMNDLGFGPSQALHTFRIIQEALQNTIKHAHAASVIISFSKTDGQIRVCIKDDGTFAEPDIQQEGGSGIGNMKKRAEDMKGILKLITENHGTEVWLEIPVHS